MIIKKSSAIIHNTEEGEMEISVQGSSIIFNNNEMDATYVFFSIDKDDWIELRKFIDKELGITNESNQPATNPTIYI